VSVRLARVRRARSHLLAPPPRVPYCARINPTRHLYRDSAISKGRNAEVSRPRRCSPRVRPAVEITELLALSTRSRRQTSARKRQPAADERLTRSAGDRSPTTAPNDNASGVASRASCGVSPARRGEIGSATSSSPAPQSSRTRFGRSILRSTYASCNKAYQRRKSQEGQRGAPIVADGNFATYA
jgi:hypothetical protein